ncbi:hypothetical protein BD626DRAFT_473308 [Schizophyllum amplum]|uniref:Uncharacterized protein n=1 Tax=Schizophyllum amplum TaxID=97359 RepID=A0A550CWN6_9AGAR|nr:hypothetical protein BD626DRAFT_473308 [Auriculariopsis ampla]
MVQVNSIGTYKLRQEFYALARLSKATLPKDAGGSFGKRIGVSVAGSRSWTLVVSAFVPERTSSSAQARYSLVVLNCDAQKYATDIILHF